MLRGSGPSPETYCCLPGIRHGLASATDGQVYTAILLSAPLQAFTVHRCPCNLLPTLNWTTPLVFCSALAPAIFHLLSLKKKIKQKKKSGRVGGRADLRSKLQDEAWEERITFEEEVQSNGEAVLYAQAWSSERRFSVSPSELRCHRNTSATTSISSLIQRLWKQNKMRRLTSIHYLLQLSLNECKKLPQAGRIYLWRIRNANNGKIKDRD